MPGLTFDELADHLRTQVGFLESSVRAFDDGNRLEARRLATSLRVLLHDTKASQSVLGRMKLKDIVQWSDSRPPFWSEPTRGSFASPGALVLWQGGPQGWAITSLTQAGLPIDPEATAPFATWWAGQAVVRSRNNDTYRRRNLVLWLANKDGGAHVDTLPMQYREFAQEGVDGVTFGPDGRSFIGSSIDPAVRQIAAEVLVSLRSQLPHLFT